MAGCRVGIDVGDIVFLSVAGTALTRKILAYGVVIDPETLAVDSDATATLRTELGRQG